MRPLAALGWSCAAFFAGAVIFTIIENRALRDRESVLWDQIQRYEEFLNEHVRKTVATAEADIALSDAEYGDDDLAGTTPRQP